MAVPAQGGSRRHHERERAPRCEILGQELLRYRRGRRDRAREGRQLRAQPLPGACRPACALDQARRRTDLGGVDQEDGRQRPQGSARHPQYRPRFAQELRLDPAHRASRETVTVLHSIEKWLWRCELVLVYASVLAALAMMCLTSADALSRYLLNRPIIGAYEITEKYLMVATIFLGLSFAYRGGVFIRVTFLVDRLSGTAKLAADYFAYFVSLVFCAVVLTATAQQALRSLADETNLSALPIPVGPAY